MPELLVILGMVVVLMVHAVVMLVMEINGVAQQIGHRILFLLLEIM
jgi:hypothetical protein